MAGAVVTGGIQLWLARINARRQRAATLRDERKAIYVEALWLVSNLPSTFRRSVLQENAAREAGIEFAEPDFSHLEGLERAEFELQLLGKPQIAAAVKEYLHLFMDWLNAPEPEGSEGRVVGFDALEEALEGKEAEIVAMMRADLDVD